MIPNNLDGLEVLIDFLEGLFGIECVPRVPLVSCFAVIPTYFEARDPGVILFSLVVCFMGVLWR